MSIEGEGPDGQISLNPSPDLFESEIKRMLRDGIELVNIPEPLLGHRDLQTYVTAAASGGSDSHAAAPTEADHGGDEDNAGGGGGAMSKNNRDVVTLVYSATNFHSLNNGIFHGLKGW